MIIFHIICDYISYNANGDTPTVQSVSPST